MVLLVSIYVLLQNRFIFEEDEPERRHIGPWTYYYLEILSNSFVAMEARNGVKGSALH